MNKVIKTFEGFFDRDTKPVEKLLVKIREEYIQIKSILDSIQKLNQLEESGQNMVDTFMEKSFGAENYSRTELVRIEKRKSEMVKDLQEIVDSKRKEFEV
jgi:hypothetical protein